MELVDFECHEDRRRCEVQKARCRLLAARLCMTVIANVSSAIRSLLSGLVSHARGAAVVCAHPRLLLLRCLATAALTTAAAGALAVGMWLLCLPLRLPPVRYTVAALQRPTPRETKSHHDV